MWSCYTFDENIDNLNSEQQKEIEFYKNLIHFLNLSDKLIFLCDSKNELKDERINELINKFSTEEKKIEKKYFILIIKSFMKIIMKKKTKMNGIN